MKKKISPLRVKNKKIIPLRVEDKNIIPLQVEESCPRIEFNIEREYW